MLNYFVMAYPDRVDRISAQGDANPIYSSISPDYGNNLYAANGYFIWTKSLSGYPWDIKTFDSNFIYDRATELGWSDPTSFKRLNTDLPHVGTTMCADGSAGGDTQNFSVEYALPIVFAMPALSHPAAWLRDEFHLSPVWVNVGNVGSTKARIFTYRVGLDPKLCDLSISWRFQPRRGIGLYDWKYYVNKQGSFVLQQESVINQKHGGQTTPALPCTSSYE